MSKNSQFEKFINKTRGSVIKEQLKQDKKIAKKERAAAIEKRFEEKRRLKAANHPSPAPGAAKPVNAPKKSKADAPADPRREGAFPQMPLNKYIAHSGISGRREAAE